MNTDIVPVEHEQYMPVLSIRQAVDRHNAMVEFVQTVMHDGVDFGTIPGTPRPTLYKPGAEKLCTLFGLTARFAIVRSIEDWTGMEHGFEPFFYYYYRCRLWRGPQIIAESDGSCNSWESKYRWRWVSAADVPPGLAIESLVKRPGALSEFDFAVDKAETTGKYGKPATYWQQFREAIQAGTARKVTKKTNAGKILQAWEIDTTVYRIANEDVAGLVNTVQKMAQKRALIAATLLAVNASEFFTQDVEDIILEGEYREVPAPKQAAQPDPAPTTGNEIDMNTPENKAETLRQEEAQFEDVGEHYYGLQWKDKRAQAIRVHLKQAGHSTMTADDYAALTALMVKRHEAQPAQVEQAQAAEAVQP